MFNLKSLIIVVLILISSKIFSKCVVINSHDNDDLLISLIRSKEKCPENVLELKRVFEEDGLKAKPAMVANRGYHNPKYGSFSIFETLEGRSDAFKFEIKAEHLYFGHFTGKNSSNTIFLDQQNARGKLLVELIAYDFKKKVYNFYELIGESPNSKWFYRGDSYDALNDNKNLKIKGAKPKPSKMRCSACHNSGGPIMKELSFPHSDWWTKRNLIDFGNAKLSQNLTDYLSEFVDASQFSKNVKDGMVLLDNRNISSTLSIKEQLRPLFCTTEINLVSDKEMFLHGPFQRMEITSEVFVNPLLTGIKNILMNKQKYTEGLLTLNSFFPESGGLDSMYGFLAPVKSFVDINSIKSLIKNNIIDEEFALDILFVDYKKPLFSKARCDLLNEISHSQNWKVKFLNNVKNKKNKISKKLYMNLIVDNKDKYRVITEKYLARKELLWMSQEGVISELYALNELRNSVFEDEISQNPRGQILEPGFRIIFPKLK